MWCCTVHTWEVHTWEVLEDTQVHICLYEAFEADIPKLSMIGLVEVPVYVFRTEGREGKDEDGSSNLREPTATCIR